MDDFDDFNDLELYYDVRETSDTIKEKQVSKTFDEEEEDEELDEKQKQNKVKETTEVKQKVPAKRRVVRNPRLTLNLDRIKQSNGIPALVHALKGVKFEGKNFEKEDLNKVMLIMEHWAHRLMPHMKFDDFIEKLEQLGSKRATRTYLNKIRFDLILDTVKNEENIVQSDNDDQGFSAEQAFDEIIRKDKTKEILEITKDKSLPSSNLTEEQRRMIAENARKAAEKRKELALQRVKQDHPLENIFIDNVKASSDYVNGDHEINKKDENLNKF